MQPVRFRAWRGILVAAALLPVILLAGYLSLSSAENERLKLEQGMRDTASALSLAVDGQVASAKSGLDALVASSSFATRDFQRFREEAERFLQDHEGWLTVVDETGQQHLNTRLARDAPLPKTDNYEWLSNIFEAQPYNITDAITGPVVKQTFVAISRRAVTSDGKALVLTLSVAPESQHNIAVPKRE